MLVEDRISGYVYAITNNVTGKKYIGVTTRSVEKRWLEHKSRARFHYRNSKIYQSMRKHGIENFSISILCTALDTLNNLNELEKYFIIELDTLHNGYNLTDGGEVMEVSREVGAKISSSKLGHIVSPETRAKLSKSNSRVYRVLFTDGTELLINHLRQFCTDNLYSYNYILKLINKRGFSKVRGKYQPIQLIERYKL